MYTITLSDGTVLPNVKVNGDNFISPTVISDDIFTGKLGLVTVATQDEEFQYHDMVLVQNKVMGEESWFILREQTSQEKMLTALKTTIDDNVNGITDVQLALAEVFELITGGG